MSQAIGTLTLKPRVAAKKMKTDVLELAMNNVHENTRIK